MLDPAIPGQARNDGVFHSICFKMTAYGRPILTRLYYSNAKILFQSSFMLITVQPCFLASS
jgi:hypothetical protein